MSEFCRHHDCFVPDVSCVMGELDAHRCQFWTGVQPADADERAGDAEQVTTLPWHGNSLGTTDTPFVAARSRPLTIGVVGAEGAGKTTLLGTVYSLVARGRFVGGRRFSGSYTLGGWEAIAHNLRWQGVTPPSFPPHTPRGAARAPGLLHLALRDGQDRARDVLLTDAPGEWFRRWAVDREAADAEGARWVARYADAFMLFADSEALAGLSRGVARTTTQLLTQRLAAEAGERPIAIVWAKADVAVPERTRTVLTETFERYLPAAHEFHVTVKVGNLGAAVGEEGAIGVDAMEQRFLDLVDWLVARDAERRCGALPDPAPAAPDPFFSFRGT